MSAKNYDEEASTGRSRFSQFGTSSNSRSFEIESWSYIKHKDYNLQVMQKVKTESTRTIIPANFPERLAFYRSYTSSVHKTHINCMQDVDIRLFVWYYVSNVIFKALPSVYTQMFLSNYATDEHMYMSKMSPVSYGTNYIMLLAAFCEIQLYIALLVRYVFYISTGVYDKMPWLTCSVKIPPGYLCVPPNNYRAFLENATKTFNTSVFIQRDGSISVFDDQGNVIHHVVMSPVIHYRTLHHLLSSAFRYKESNEVLIYFIIIWIATCACYGQIFKKYLWVVLNKLQWVLTFVFLISLGHITWQYLENNTPKRIPQTYDKYLDYVNNNLRNVDVDYLAESMIAPPLIHVLRGRSHEPVNPNIDGGAVVLSNALYYLLRGFMTTGLRHFCRNHFGTSVRYKINGHFPWFILWPVYFSVFPMGGFLALLFFIIHFIVDFFTFVILLYCTLDILHCEWPKIKKWMYMIAIVVLSFGYTYYIYQYRAVNAFLIIKSLATCLESVVVFWLYPVGRLIDDITFNYGSTPSTIRIWSLKLTPLYYIIKTYIVHKSFYGLYTAKINKFPTRVDFWIYVGTWLISPVILIVGVIYVITKYKCIRKESLQTLFRPLPRWGPPDHIQRQLRKQFDSRVYIKSQSSRYLSRHHLSKEEDIFYKLDLCYERQGRRSTVIHDTFKFDIDKKTV